MKMTKREMSKYIVKKNSENTQYLSTGGLKVYVPKNTEYSIYFVDTKQNKELHVCDIKDHFINPKGIAEGIVELLNRGNIILDLSV